MKLNIAIIFITACMLVTANSQAQVNRLVHYQGELKNSDGTPFEGTTDIRFSIYTRPNSDQSIWTETHRNVEIENGNYEVFLGSKDHLDLSFYEYYLEVDAKAPDVPARRVSIVGSGYNFRLWFLFAAYTIVWLAIFGYLLSISRRQKRIIAELENLARVSKVGV
ncbi:CcmD family protein [candidate division KSB1 bacterium]|nr:CcmD family protein [candidate division KSB1 bacterium]NIR73327.1 CcmD family protein [candidate division KSB1 bacterium]NIS27033.1 CcmD family protein [candidate division KSB1 bacterium]NIT73873.1 CcmD family protein [candidate division KSB1 bacterium]NIU27778.1 CcmD family protein [candidate division KSB1 bacterium]